jgi:hypothetical protein
VKSARGKNGRALRSEKRQGFLSQKNGGAFSPRKMAGLSLPEKWQGFAL